MKNLLYVLVVLLALGWIAGVTLKIAGGLIHLLLLLALIGILLTYMKDRKRS